MERRCCIARERPLGVNRAREHVVPDWLLESLGIGLEQLTHVVAESDSEEIVETRGPHAMHSFREGRVCDKCNSGWMSDLEGAVKPILLGVLSNERNISALSPDECERVSRWTLKTAIVLSYGTPLGQGLERPHLSFLRTNKAGLPGGIGVFGATVSANREFDYRQRNHWPNLETPGLRGIAEMMVSRAYKVSLQLRHLLVMVAYLPRPNSRFVLSAGLHIPLWPAEPLFPVRRIDLSVRTPYDVRQVVEIFNDSLGALHLPEGAVQQAAEESSPAGDT